MFKDSTAPSNQGERLRTDRRGFIRMSTAATTAVGLSMVGTQGAFATGTNSPAPASPPEPLVIFDMQSLNSLDVSVAGNAASAYDQMMAVATLQGIVNRDLPRLYVDFSSSNDYFDGSPDEYWLDKLQSQHGFLAGRATQRMTDLDALINKFRSYLKGAVTWDPSVFATSNVATTVAGAKNLLPIRYDPTPGSIYQRYVAAPATSPIHLPAKVSFVSASGASMFTGTGTIPGTGLASTGSAKNDAYLWAKVNYLDSGLSDPAVLGYYLDGYWLAAPQIGGIAAACVMNHDYIVSKRGFAIDLSPWSDEAANDDPKQPVGTDRQTFEAVLASASAQANREMIAIHGFTPWQYKYTNASLPQAGTHDPVGTEWEGVALATSYNAYLDADAPSIGAMANASVFAHTPLQATYQQPGAPTNEDLIRRGFLAEDGSVVAKRYVMFYVGDYDSAAWMYNTLPGLWDDPNRGAVPLNWAFNPNLSERIAPAFTYTRATSTPNDHFIAGDSGAGYLNPTGLEAPRDSGLPSGLATWQRHCTKYYRKWDISITGFVIDGNNPPMDLQAQQTYAKFSPNGFGEQLSAQMGIVGMTGFVRSVDIGGTVPQAAAQIEGLLGGDTSATALAPEFHTLRAILQTPTWYKQTVDRVHADIPDAAVEFVDAYTFYALVRHYLQDQVIASVEGSLALVVAGTSVPVSIDLTNFAQSSVSGTVTLTLPEGWTQSEPASFTLAAGATDSVTIDVTASADAPLGQTDVVAAVVRANGHSRAYAFSAVTASGTVGTVTATSVLGATNAESKITQVEVSGDGVTEAVTQGGQSGRQLVQVVANDLNMYFKVDPGVAFDGVFDATFTVEYFDAGTGSWVLQYDSNNAAAPLSGAYATALTVTNADTGTWKTATATVHDAKFDHRENGGADFRINSGLPLIIHSMTVVISGPGVNPGS